MDDDRTPRSELRIRTPDGGALVVRVDEATRLTSLDLESPDGAPIVSRVLDADDAGRLVAAIEAAMADTRDSDMPAIIDVSAVIGRD